MFDAAPASLPLDFAVPEMKEAVAPTQPGSKGKAGFKVRGHFFMENQVITLGLEVTNCTDQSIAQDFDLKFNKNSFALTVAGAGNLLTIPQPGQSTYAKIPCSINKANYDGKTPPKNPFMIQIAMKTALDVFLFQIPCKLMCFLNPAKVMTGEEFQGFWQQINPAQQLQFTLQAHELYGGYATNTE
jgi:hypothetical protein